jgi:ribonuclease I
VANDYFTKIRELHQDIANSNFIPRRAQWKELYDSSFYKRIGKAYEQMSEFHISPSRAIIRLLPQEVEGERGIKIVCPV